MKNKGFTLIELMVTITIMLIMTSVVIFNYNKFNDSTLLSSFAYDLSLTIRQAQIYGVAVKGPGSQNNTITPQTSYLNDFRGGYGVHFDASAGAQYPLVLFADSPTIMGQNGFYKGDGLYTPGETALQKFSFERGIKISQICEVNVSNNCISTNSLTADITFSRPDPEAYIALNGVSKDTVKIVLTDSSGSLTRSVIVYSTGQISVQ